MFYFVEVFHTVAPKNRPVLGFVANPDSPEFIIQVEPSEMSSALLLANCGGVLLCHPLRDARSVFIDST